MSSPILYYMDIHTYHAGIETQTCDIPALNPRDETAIVPSNLDMFFLYPAAPFNSAMCTGTVLAYEYCYQYDQTNGQRPVVFTVVTLEDMGDSYRIVKEDEIQENRGCVTDTVGAVERCCERVDLAEGFVVNENYVYGFLTPATPPGSNRLLSLSTVSMGHQLNAAVYNTIGGNTVSKQSLGIGSVSPSPVPDRSFQFIVGEYTCVAIMHLTYTPLLVYCRTRTTTTAKYCVHPGEP